MGQCVTLQPAYAIEQKPTNTGYKILSAVIMLPYSNSSVTYCTSPFFVTLSLSHAILNTVCLCICTHINARGNSISVSHILVKQLRRRSILPLHILSRALSIDGFKEEVPSSNLSQNQDKEGTTVTLFSLKFQRLLCQRCGNTEVQFR